MNNGSVKSPNGEESQEEWVHVDQEAVEDIGSEDGGKMESEASADHHEEDAGDDAYLLSECAVYGQHQLVNFEQDCCG